MNEIKTPWGSISSKVSLFPLYYLIFIYGFIYILPFGEIVVGSTWFDLLKKEDGPLEWLEFSQYFISSIFGFFIAAEEISWGERITGFNLDSISEISIQGETNFHNLPFFHNYLLDPALQIICIFLGWIGWRKWPYLTSFPSKKLSLFFLLVALFFAYYDLSWASTISHIRNDQEIFEFLLSTGIFLHFWDNLKI